MNPQLLPLFLSDLDDSTVITYPKYPKTKEVESLGPCSSTIADVGISSVVVEDVVA
jgi:hypothetical protein